MPALDMTGLDTQGDAMAAIDMMVEDYDNGFISGIELIHAVKAINTEWKI
jgi:hypothetical protein